MNNKFTFDIADYLVVALYFALIVFLGVWTSRKKKISNSKDDFLLAGRKLTLPVFVATLVSTWYGNILGVGEFVYSNGLAAWICFGLPYYIAALIYAVFIAKKVRKSNVYSIPEQLRNSFGRKAGTLSSVIILLITIPAAYILMIGIIIRMFTGFSLEISIIIGAVLSLVYIYKGGFKADVMANTVQFVLMFIGFTVLFIFSVIKLGSPDQMISKLPGNHLSIFGGFSWQVIVVWYIIAFQTFVDPGFHQRCSAAKTPEIARDGILLSIICWAVFDFLTLFTGLYAKAYFQNIVPVMSFPVLGEAILPVFWKGLFVASVLSPIMASLDGYSFVSAFTIGHELLEDGFKKQKIELTSKQLTNIGLIITSILSILLAILIPSAVQLIYKSASVAVPGLLMPLLLSFRYKDKINQKPVFLMMLISSGVSFIWTVLKIFGEQRYFDVYPIIQNIEPMIPGILISLIWSSVIILKLRRKNDLDRI